MIALHPTAIQISHPFKFEKDPGCEVIRVIGRGDPLPEDCDAVIVDDSHGKGKAYNPSYALDAVKHSTIPVILAGGLTPGNVGDAIRRIHPYAVDVASGVEETSRDKRSQKNSGIYHRSTGGITWEIKDGLGKYGGQYVPETLMNALIELEDAYQHTAHDPAIRTGTCAYQSEYAGRPTPLTFCTNMSRDLGFKVYLKREDLVHGGSHKLNNTLGQALLAKRMGKNG